MCRLKVDELTAQSAACNRSSCSEEQYAKDLDLAMAEMRRQMHEQERLIEMQYTEKLTAVKQEASAVKDELKARLSAVDCLCEKLRDEKATAIIELEERHRLRLLSIAESQDDQVTRCSLCCN